MLSVGSKAKDFSGAPIFARISFYAQNPTLKSAGSMTFPDHRMQLHAKSVSLIMNMKSIMNEKFDSEK